MLRFIEFKDVGPASTMLLEFAARLNILTGDNGLGKSFVLENAWWALTRNWTDRYAKPFAEEGREPCLSFEVEGKSGKGKPIECNYDYEKNNWKAPRGSRHDVGVVVYARADSGISIWDSVRKSALNFKINDILDGLHRGSTVLCKGLVNDWVMWQVQQDNAFKTLKNVLKKLSPSLDELLRPGPPIRTSVDDVREVPTLELSYGIVPLTHASAGMKRVISLAYLLVWAITEHRMACNRVGKPPTDRMIVLFDEVEAHLHPQWQRVFLPALLEVTWQLMSSIEAQIQIIATTHAPMVLASMEPTFREEIDRVFTFDLIEGAATVSTRPWAKQGDVSNWLVSESFGLAQARSKDAETAIEAAEAFMRGDQDLLPPNLQTLEQIHNELLRVLASHDVFWPRWIVKNQMAE